MEKAVWGFHIFSTFFLTGVIWVIQIVQYPFFSYVGRENFREYHDDYRFWITPVVAPAMILELLTGIFLIVLRPESELLWAGLPLILVVWASTFFIQVPLHEKLAGGFDSQNHRALVKTNWIRTVAWTMRSLLLMSVLFQGFAV